MKKIKSQESRVLKIN